LIRSLDREATQAFQRQNLDLAIAKWDRVLQLDPANRKARLERERALELTKKMNEKFGGK
jgi:cytochrome c-type biogenesis protein CcmH/NrfG